jgi:transposase
MAEVFWLLDAQWAVIEPFMPRNQPGPERGGQTTKIHALVDVLGRPGVVLPTPGNASDVKTAPDVLADAPGRVRRLIADWATTPTGCGPI